MDLQFENKQPAGFPGSFTVPVSSYTAVNAQEAAERSSSNSEGLPPKSIAILLCTYNGQRFLDQQLDSFETQTQQSWAVWVSDDGSTDSTLDILQHYRERWGNDRLHLQPGPGRGFVANFLSLISNQRVLADYYAFSDQDDVWEPDKLERACRWLNGIEPCMPAVYCSRTRLISDDNGDIGLSPLFSKPPSFSNALVQSLAGGNTMVLNQAARRILLEAGVTQGVVSHDWWIYLIITGCGGKIFYDRYPTVRYRQHTENLVGANTAWRARISRVRWLLSGRFRTWSGEHIAALKTIRDRFPIKNQALLNRFEAARQQRLIPRLISFARCKIYRQTVFGNFGLFVAVLLNKI